MPPDRIGFVVGFGERRECGRYEQCLREFVLRLSGRRRGVDAHCPVGCPGWCCIPREVLFAPALRKKE